MKDKGGAMELSGPYIPDGLQFDGGRQGWNHYLIFTKNVQKLKFSNPKYLT